MDKWYLRGFMTRARANVREDLPPADPNAPATDPNAAPPVEPEAPEEGAKADPSKVPSACPACAHALTGMLACPVCATMLPSMFCPWCGASVWADACPACDAPISETPKEGEPVPVVELPVGDPITTNMRSASLGKIASHSCRDQFRGELEAYASSELKDAHGTIISQEEVARLLGSANVDQMHNFQGIDGVSIAEVVPVVRQVDGKEVKHTKVRLLFDLAKEAAKDAFEKVRSGIYKGLSIAFRVPESVGAALAAGATDVINTLSELPFVSLVDDPSNGEALIECYRSKPKPWTARYDELLGRLRADLREEPPAPTEDPIALLRREFSGALLAARTDMERMLAEALGGKVALTVSELDASVDRRIASLEERLTKAMAEEISKLRVVDAPRRRIAPDTEAPQTPVPNTTDHRREFSGRFSK